MILKQQFKVGDRVRVTDDDYVYSRYAEFVKKVAPTYLNCWIDNSYPDMELPYQIVAMHQHLASCRSELLAVIYNGKNAYAINIKGLEFLHSPKSRVVLKPEYQEITATLKNGYVKLGHNLVIPAECVDIVDEPKYYSGTVICAYCEDGLFTPHKAYIVKDGELYPDHGTSLGHFTGFKSVEDINKAYSASSFFELVY